MVIEKGVSMKNVDVSVVVCTHNRWAMLQEALTGLLTQQVPQGVTYEIVVVDDGSTDNTSAVVEDIISRSSVAINHVRVERGGIPRARNRGIRAAAGKWIAFFDDDQLAEPHWLAELYGFASERELVCVGGQRRLRLPAGAHEADLPWVCRTLLGETLDVKEPFPSHRGHFINSGNVILRRSALESVGGFDESLQRGSDTHLVAKLRKRGITPWYNPRAVVHHVIPTDRLEEGFLFDVSRRWGSGFALRDREEFGLLKTVVLATARLGRAALIDSPLLGVALMTGDRKGALARRCLLSRTRGYVAGIKTLLKNALPHGRAPRSARKPLN